VSRLRGHPRAPGDSSAAAGLLAVFCEQNVQGLGHQIIHRAVQIDGQFLEPGADLLRQMRGDRDGAGAGSNFAAPTRGVLGRIRPGWLESLNDQALRLVTGS
jgi:hypothetical protein